MSFSRIGHVIHHLHSAVLRQEGVDLTDPEAQVWIDFPANSAHRHDFSFALNFADCHSEIWQHRDPATEKLTHNRTEQVRNKDLQRLARATVTLKEHNR